MSYLKHKPGSIEEMMANQAKKLNDNAYQDMFKKEQKKDFFNKIDDKYKAKNEAVNEGITSPSGQISQKNKDLLKVNNYITVKGKVYVIDKVSLKNGVYTMKAFDKNGKMHTISSKDVDSVEHWKNSLKVASYDPKNEDVNEKVSDKQLDTFHKKLDNLVHKTIGKSSDEKKEAVDNPYAVGMAQAMKSTGDKPPLKKSTITKAHDIAKSIEKDEKNEEKDVPKGYHKMPDGTVMKDSEHKKETHSFMTKDMNKSKKDAKGEKEIVDPEPKLKQESMLDAVKNVWQMSAEELEKIKNEAKYMKAQRMNQYKAEKDDKNKTGTADTGSKKTKVDVEPSVDYKN